MSTRILKEEYQRSAPTDPALTDWTKIRALADGATGVPKDLQLIRTQYHTSAPPPAAHLRRMQQ